LAIPDVLLSATTKILTYLSQVNPESVCKSVLLYDNRPTTECSIPPIWRQSLALATSLDLLSRITTKAGILNLLGFIAGSGTAVPSQLIPPIQTCDRSALGLTLQEYSYLWDGLDGTPFCKIRLNDGSINYSAIAQLQELYNDSNTTGTLGMIVQGYTDAIPWFNPTEMKNACSSKYTYDDMATGNAIQQVCGCYIALPPVGEFTSDERFRLQQNPECLPSCLSASVRYSVGGVAVPCQQSLCIVDQVNITGTTASISQVCPQCALRYECICYVHVNGQTLDNSTCSTVYTVSEKGEVTATINNKAPPLGSGIRSGFKTALRSKASFYGFIAVGVVFIVIVIVILLVMHLGPRTKANPIKPPQVL
jgi:hypothetical protein